MQKKCLNQAMVYPLFINKNLLKQCSPTYKAISNNKQFGSFQHKHKMFICSILTSDKNNERNKT